MAEYQYRWRCTRCPVSGGAHIRQQAEDEHKAHAARCAMPMTATEIRERQAAWHAELLPKLHEIAVKHGLIPEPPTFMGVPVRMANIDTAPPMPPVVPTLLEIARMTEMLNRLNAPLQDAPYKGPPPAITKGWSCGIPWSCDTCGVGGTTATGKLAFDADRAHCATVDHDRNTETMLRGNVKSALASVETAREKLYDYLKSKGRAA